MRVFNRLLKETPAFSNLMGQIDAQQRLLKQVEGVLPPEWQGYIRGIAPGEGGWTLLVDASVWASRLRMYLPQLNEKTRMMWRVRVIVPTEPIRIPAAPRRLNRPPPPP
ncbi:hypothetical protein CCP4SC76_3130003 [Gammaproteobacteria bacterium]